MPNDWVIFISVTTYLFVMIIAFVASIVVPADDLARELHEKHWTGRVRGMGGEDFSPAVVFVGSTTEIS